MSNFKETALALNAKWDAAFNAKDAAAVAASYDSEAAVIPSGAAQVSGHAAILDFWKGAIAQGITDHKLELIEAIENEVEIANKDADWRHEMMTLEMKIRDRERMAAQKNKEQTAIKMIKKGMDNELIQELTELPFSRIEELRTSLKNSVA